MTEIFSKPAVGAIIETIIENKKYILVQERQKENGDVDNGMLEIPAGKIREYENIFEALRREVKEETGLKVTKIFGEENTKKSIINDHETISFEPYCMTQNLSGAYSLILFTFLCTAEGELEVSTNETKNIRWVKNEDLRNLLKDEPERIFIMHINALKKYFNMITN